MQLGTPGALSVTFQVVGSSGQTSPNWVGSLIKSLDAVPSLVKCCSWLQEFAALLSVSDPVCIAICSEMSHLQFSEEWYSYNTQATRIVKN